MPIDRERALSAPPVETTGRYSEADVILYHLGLGAGNPPSDPDELRYTYESRLEVLPSFASVARVGPTDALMNMPGIQLDQTKVLQLEQEVELHQPVLPRHANVAATRRVVEVYDKGNAAVLQYETKVRLRGGGELYTSCVTILVRGEGGCGGPRGTKPNVEPQTSPPDGSVRVQSLPQQALVFRLCGDMNPLHADPDVARGLGLDRPILHGLCVFGMVCKALTDSVLRPESIMLRRFGGRFSGVFYPGETLEVRWWRDPSRIRATAIAVERSQPVLSDVMLQVA